MEENTNTETVEPVVETPTEEVKPTEEVEKQPTRNELLRELSKEYDVNLFDAEGIKKFKEYTESQKTEAEKAQEQLSAFEQEKQTWQKEKLEYESKLKASELGIGADYLEDALKLAEGNPDNLANVLKKYPIFKAKGEMTIGVNNPDDYQAPTGDTEAQQYLAERAKTNPAYAKYLKK